jgi:uncharacterized protein YdeI (YjbR/CyaY-like superfamily)
MSDPRIDQYISKAQPFAQPILKKLREIIRKAHPGITETIKWGAPAFEYKGQICIIAGFKQHCVLAFSKGELLDDPHGYFHSIKADGGPAMGQLGRIESMKDIPSVKILTGFIRQAVQLNEADIKVPKKKPAAEKDVSVPEILEKALLKNKKAKAVFDAFSPSCKREYTQWIADAKTESTREKRTAQAVAWMAEGEKRNWKYEKC